MKNMFMIMLPSKDDISIYKKSPQIRDEFKKNIPYKTAITLNISPQLICILN